MINENAISDIVKRIFDFTAALIGLIFLVPIFGIIAILIKKDTPGPVFYWCERTGKGNKIFRMLKFRTMYDDLSSDGGPRVTSKGDSRITPFGHWLRDSKVNELPQLWNVLIGEMSLVGPRPEDPEISQHWPEEASREILSIKPGITSPASILYHDEENLLSSTDVMDDYYNSIMPNKMRLDRLYVKNRAFASDLDIIFWTLVIILPKMTSANVSESYLFSGVFYRLVHRHVSWFIIDFVTSFLAVGLAGLLWRSQEPLNWGVQYLVILALLLAFAFSSVNAVTGLNRIEWSRATTEDAVHLIVCSLIITISSIFINAIPSFHIWYGFPPIPLVLIIMIGLFAQIGFLITRYRWRLLTAFPKFWLNVRQKSIGVGERVLIVGDGEGFDIAARLLRQKKYEYAFTVVGIVADDILNKKGMRFEGCQVLGKISDIPEIVEKFDVGLILFTIPDTHPDIRKVLLNYGQNSDIRLVFIDKLIRIVDLQLQQGGVLFTNPFTRESDLGFATMFDEATSLPNRFLFNDRLQHSLAYSKRYHTDLAVMIIDLDGATNMRDRYGAEINKLVLQEITKRLYQSIRCSDTLASLGEYEFAVIIENISDQDIMETIKNRVFTTLSKPIEVKGNKIHLCINLRYCYGTEIDCEKDFLANFYLHMMNQNHKTIVISN